MSLLLHCLLILPACLPALCYSKPAAEALVALRHHCVARTALHHAVLLVALDHRVVHNRPTLRLVRRKRGRCCNISLPTFSYTQHTVHKPLSCAQPDEGTSSPTSVRRRNARLYPPHADPALLFARRCQAGKDPRAPARLDFTGAEGTEAGRQLCSLAFPHNHTHHHHQSRSYLAWFLGWPRRRWCWRRGLV